MSEQLTRRSFLKGVAGAVGAAAVSSIAGCAAKESPATSAAAESTTTAAETATETASAGNGTYIPGTYTGTADGIHSTITVTMTFDEEKVTDVNQKFSADAIRQGLVLRKGKKVFHKVML